MATAFLKINNRGVSSLASSINDSDLSLTVATGEGANFPSSFPFHVTIGAEILSCTGRTTDVLTVARAQQSTTAAAHAAGEVVALNITEKHVSDLNTAVNTLENSTAELLKDGSRALAGAWNMGSQALTNVNVDSGAVDGAIIGANSAAAIKGTTVDATTDFTIGSLIITDGVITDATGLLFAAAIDFGNENLTNVNINSGAIDGAVIGAASAAAGTFAALVGTTIDASTDFTVGATVITDGVITDATGLQLAAAVTVTGVITGSDTTAATAIATAAAIFAGGIGVTKETFFGLNTTWNTSEDSAAVADQVSIGRFEIGAGNTVLALSQETTVAAETDETKFSNKLQVRINGSTYFIMLTVS